MASHSRRLIFTEAPNYKLILNSSDDGVQHSEDWVFGLCPLSGILEIRKHNVLFSAF